MRYVRRFNSKRGPRLGSGSALTMPYHAYAPLPHWPVTPSPSPSRVSSVTFPLCVCAVGNLCSCQDASRSSRRSSRETGSRAAGLAAWLAFYFILFALITSPATLLKNIFACWEISRSLFPAPGPQPAAPCLLSPCRACKDMACHAAGPAVVPAVVAVVVVVLASAYVSLGLLM